MLLLVGESINATIPAVKNAIVARDAEAIGKLAKGQEEAGADMLDVNAGVPGQNDTENLVWTVQAVQAASSLPLMLDSSSPEAIAAALKVYKGPPPILNSITGEMTEAHERLLAAAVENNCGLVLMCIDKEGIHTDPERRARIAEGLVIRATKTGLKTDQLYVDPLAMAIATDDQAGPSFLEALRLIRERVPEVHTTCGNSNISFGMPKRKLLNATFAAILVAYGMDTFLTDVRDRQLMATLIAAEAVMGHDEFGQRYLKAFRAGKLGGRKKK